MLWPMGLEPNLDTFIRLLLNKRVDNTLKHNSPINIPHQLAPLCFYHFGYFILYSYFKMI